MCPCWGGESQCWAGYHNDGGRGSGGERLLAFRGLGPGTPDNPRRQADSTSCSTRVKKCVYNYRSQES